jgi:tetratricopeptide (TPR) repeat protein
MKMRPSLVLSALLVVTGTAHSAASQEPELLAIPFPDVSMLEESVALQLEQMQDLLRGRLDQPDSEPGELAEAYGELGRLYHAYELSDASEPCYLNAIELAPGDFRWVYYLGNLYQVSGRFEEAARYYEQALDLRNDDVPALIHLGEVRLELNDLDPAEAALQKALRLKPSSPAAKSTLGQVALSRQDYQDAVEYLEDALAQMPQANRLHYLLGMAYRGLGELDRAREHLAQRGMVGVRPVDPLMEEIKELVQAETIHILRGRMAFRARRYQDAAEEFREALEIRPDSPPAIINLGTALGRMGDAAGAVAAYERALQVEPDNVTAHYNLGLMLAQQEEYAAAIPHLRAVVTAEPLDRQARLELARLLRADGLLEQALTAYGDVLDLEPLTEMALIERAEVTVELRRFAEAKQMLEQAHEALPTSGHIAHGLARLLAGCPELDLRNGERALELAGRVFEASRTISHAETVAMAFAEVGRCSDAAEWQERAAQAAEDSGDQVRAARLRTILPLYDGGPPCRYPVIGNQEPAPRR